MSTLPTSDTYAQAVAENAYEVVRAIRLAQGAQDLPTWSQVPDLKKIYLSNAARAALDGKDVWDVWAISCGEEPNDAVQTFWRQRPPNLQILPKVFVYFARGLAQVAGNLSGDVGAAPVDLLNDTVPDLDGPPEPTPLVDTAVEEHGLGSEEVSDALSTENEERETVAAE